MLHVERPSKVVKVVKTTGFEPCATRPLLYYSTGFEPRATRSLLYYSTGFEPCATRPTHPTTYIQL